MNDSSSKKWFALHLEIEPDAREAVEYALMEAGALGTETNETRNGLPNVTGYFDDTPERETVRAKLAEALRIYSLPSSAVRTMNLSEVPNRDWLSEWKNSWQPVNVGERFVIAPPWAEVGTHDRIVIRIEPGMAFGTGTHETTRLCLNAIENYFPAGSFLDVGTGTGILAIAAAKLFSDARISACDTDSEALDIAKENARLNGVSERIEFWPGSIEESTASADTVCANLTADVIIPLLPRLLSVTCRRLVLSGILDTQEELVLNRLADCGVNQTLQVLRDGEWLAIIV